jgi:hypothetical protein
MKRSILLLLLFIITVSSFSQTWIRPEDAVHFRGELVNVIGLVSEVNTVSGKTQSGKFIKLAANHPGKSLILVILKSDLHKFESISDDLLHQYVHVKGKIVKKKGRPYIMLSSASQISIAREMELKTFEPL